MTTILIISIFIISILIYKLNNLFKKLAYLKDKHKKLKNKFNKLSADNSELIASNTILNKVKLSLHNDIKIYKNNIDRLNNDIKFIKLRYVEKDNTYTGIDGNLIKKLLLREEEYKDRIKELEYDLDEVFREDIVESKEYKKLYSENFQLKKQVENLKEYIKNLEKMNDEKYKSMADTNLYRIIDKQKTELIELKKIINIYNERNN